MGSNSIVRVGCDDCLCAHVYIRFCHPLLEHAPITSSRIQLVIACVGVCFVICVLVALTVRAAQLC
jgi:hypothetical protein